MRFRLMLAAIPALLPGPGWARAEPAPCAPATAPRPAVLAGLPAHGDILLEGGGVATIPGLTRADGVDAARARAVLLEGWRGRTLAIHRLPRDDRWGREVSLVMAGEHDMATALLLAGVALLDPTRAPEPCAEIWRAAERRARQEKRGIWAGTDAPLIAARAPGGTGLAGRFVLLQGRVTSVGERRRRVYLNFGPPGSGAAAVSIPTRLWRDLARQGISAQGLKGRSVLVRGIPETINGRILLELTHASAIELES